MSSPCHCVLCGVETSLTGPEGRGARECSLLETREFVQSRCIPTQWHYTAVLGLSQGATLDSPGTSSLCTTCFQWRRRVGNRRCMKKSLTPFDSVVLYALSPGTVAKPDKRSLRRLVHCLTSPGNQFQGLLPAPAHDILTRLVGVSEDALEERLLLAWWEVNERPILFQNGATSKCFRQMFKRHRRLAGGVRV